MLSHVARRSGVVCIMLMAAPCATRLALAQEARAQEKRAAGEDRAPIWGVAAPETRPELRGFARMVGGEWRTTAGSGTSMYDAWHWGPGERSLRVMTDGQDAGGDPWRELQVVYWHPAMEEVRLLALSPYQNGVAEGTIRLEGDEAEAIFDLYQSRVRRAIKSKWAFEGPDVYQETLLESVGGAAYQPLVEWRIVRDVPRGAVDVVAPGAEKALPLPERLSALEPYVGSTWETRVGAKGAVRVRSTFERIPVIDAIYVRVTATDAGVQDEGDQEGRVDQEGEVEARRHILDAYIYHHTGTGSIRCLALSARGGVYEGDVTRLEGGGLGIELAASEIGGGGSLVVRFDPEEGGSVRHRVWSPNEHAGSVVFESRHTRSERNGE